MPGNRAGSVQIHHIEVITRNDLGQCIQEGEQVTIRSMGERDAQVDIPRGDRLQCTAEQHEQIHRALTTERFQRPGLDGRIQGCQLSMDRDHVPMVGAD